MKRPTLYSAISFVVALLALPGLTSATPAEMSGNTTSLSSVEHNKPIAATYLALNQYPVAAPEMSAATIDSASTYDESFLTDLQQEMNLELESMIDVLDF